VVPVVAARLRFETDVSDVHSDLDARVPAVIVIDSRGTQAWEQGHLPHAVHLPTSGIEDWARETIRPGQTVVTYCWGPACNGATKAALFFAKLGYPVKEMIGGYEYWVREGYPVQTADGVRRRPADELVAPRGAVSCDC
jgi:rhodanese-related sulfurtransferase